MTATEQLQRIKSLFEQGIINEEEYASLEQDIRRLAQLQLEKSLKESVAQRRSELDPSEVPNEPIRDILLTPEEKLESEQLAAETERVLAAETEQTASTEAEQESAAVAETERVSASENAQVPTGESEQAPATESAQEPSTQAEHSESEKAPATQAEQTPATESEPSAETEQAPATDSEQAVPIGPQSGDTEGEINAKRSRIQVIRTIPPFRKVGALLVCLVLMSLFASFIITQIIKMSRYNEAIALGDEGHYQDAIVELKSMNKYRDCEKRISYYSAQDVLNNYQDVADSGDYAAVLDVIDDINLEYLSSEDAEMIQRVDKYVGALATLDVDSELFYANDINIKRNESEDQLKFASVNVDYDAYNNAIENLESLGDFEKSEYILSKLKRYESMSSSWSGYSAVEEKVTKEVSVKTDNETDSDQTKTKTKTETVTETVKYDAQGQTAIGFDRVDGIKSVNVYVALYISTPYKNVGGEARNTDAQDKKVKEFVGFTRAENAESLSLSSTAEEKNRLGHSGSCQMTISKSKFSGSTKDSAKLSLSRQ